jgi:hypothetical protein
LDAIFLSEKLGAFGVDLALLTNFFESPWGRPAAALTPENQAWVINCAGYLLRALGRLSESVEHLQIAANVFLEPQEYNTNNIETSNPGNSPAVPQFTLDTVSDAMESGVELADNGSGWFSWMVRRLR